MKQNMASLIWTYREISGTFKFFPSHTNNQFFRCYRPSFNEFEVFLHSTHPNFNYGNFGYLEISLPLKIRKLQLKKWFCTVFWESVFLCVTWKRKEGLVQNWLLKMQNFLFYVISIWYEVPKKVSQEHQKLASRKTATIPFEMSHFFSVWHLWTCSENSLCKSNG